MSWEQCHELCTDCDVTRVIMGVISSMGQGVRPGVGREFLFAMSSMPLFLSIVPHCLPKLFKPFMKLILLSHQTNQPVEKGKDEIDTRW